MTDIVKRPELTPEERQKKAATEIQVILEKYNMSMVTQIALIPKE